ncbi:hypothetical protein [Cellulomonas chengniuliangii]|uniref:NUDIX hydrolase n=1 Tax=Cellulomonas chengniuliangii TaxID=2968084 RepID=A0ABY5L4M8_9CELL|nr:hypothetical protein [Cellulomonas chengniuliangii]MCC2308369.1 hypothetical protein [Cellulomonas chengniuliangii]MCC2317386.1 hypothetical protein [Cellulomonas chengniuliangii]UUI76749.1 hypothetical protein NP064_07710 [Cellulomonas chengniuliangii]
MSWSEAAVLVAALIALAVWWVWVAASRLDRLHRKVAASLAVVDAQLLRRASAASQLAASGLMDPVSSLLVGEAAWRAMVAGGQDVPALTTLPLELDGGAAARVHGADPHAQADRGMAESELSATLRTVLDDPEEVAELREEPVGKELLDALATAWYRVQLARRFHNEAVAQTQRLRRGWAVRMLRLAGSAALPQTLELDDAWPDALGRPGLPAAPTGRTPSAG